MFKHKWDQTQNVTSNAGTLGSILMHENLWTLCLEKLMLKKFRKWGNLILLYVLVSADYAIVILVSVDMKKCLSTAHYN